MKDKAEESTFKFHYDSINSNVTEIITGTRMLFKFHYDSINSN